AEHQRCDIDACNEQEQRNRARQDEQRRPDRPDLVILPVDGPARSSIGRSLPRRLDVGENPADFAVRLREGGARGETTEAAIAAIVMRRDVLRALECGYPDG